MFPRRLLASVALCACLSACTGDPEPGAPAATTTAPAAVTLDVRLAKVTGAALKGRPPKGPLLEPAEAIRSTITAMYIGGFLDPTSWAQGFDPVLGAFAPETRGRARQDLPDLTLGSASRALTSVRPDDARIVVRFLPDGRDRPVAAIADMRFLATGLGDGGEIPIRHEGEYLLEPFDGRWLVVGYDVRGRIGA